MSDNNGEECHSCDDLQHSINDIMTSLEDRVKDFNYQADEATKRGGDSYAMACAWCADALQLRINTLKEKYIENENSNNADA